MNLPIFLKRLLFVITSLSCAGMTYYLLVPAPTFPPPPPESLISSEPADTESIYRRAYYTNLTRDQAMAYYEGNFRLEEPFSGWQFNQIRPPEEAYSVIRDQTPSSWLAEIIHPLRESLLINGFYPTDPTQQIYFGPTHYLAKITIRYLPSHPATRLTVLALAALAVIRLHSLYAKISH